jgi:hypothetical protein
MDFLHFLGGLENFFSQRGRGADFDLVAANSILDILSMFYNIILLETLKFFKSNRLY